MDSRKSEDSEQLMITRQQWEALSKEQRGGQPALVKPQEAMERNSGNLNQLKKGRMMAKHSQRSSQCKQYVNMKLIGS